MALKALLIKNDLEKLRQKQTELLKKRDELTQEEAELEAAIGEIETEEQKTLVEEKVNTHLTAADENEKDIKKVEDDITALEEEIRQLSEKANTSTAPPTDTGNAPNTKNNTNGGVRKMPIEMKAATAYERRERMRTALEQPEVLDFYKNVYEAAKRGASNTDILMPETVVNMIEIDLQYVGNIYNLVRKISLKGDARIIFAGDTPAALWLECCGPLTEVDLDFSKTDIDCYKVGAFISICNATLEDVMINLAAHIQEQLVASVRRALDWVILNGEPGAKQPTGILPSLPFANKITSSAKFSELYPHFGLLPDDVGELTAVMTRATYYEMFAPQTILPTASGQVVMPPFTRLPDGTPVVFTSSKNLPNRKMLIGDFSKYLLVRRADIVLAKSTEVKFLQDETVFKITARYDGKPLKNNYWLEITLTQPTTAFAESISIDETDDEDMLEDLPGDDDASE